MLPDTTADFYQDGEGLAKLLVEEIASFMEEQKEYDINDGFHDYLAGLISAREVVVGRLGFYDLLKDLPEWSDC